MQHFESGGTLLDFNPPDYREFFKAQKEKWDMRTKGSASKPPSSGADTATEIAPELTGHGLPLSKCEAYNRVYDQRSRSS